MALSTGDKIYVITRRLFEKDLRSHFVGEVVEIYGNLATVIGYSFVYDESYNDFIRHEEIRTRIIPLADSGIIIYLLPREVVCESIRFTFNKQQHRIITDGVNFHLNVSEFGVNR